jgi:hypothetical protein
MGNTAVMQFVGNFAEIQLVVNKQFFCFFNPVREVILFDGDPLRFGKQIGLVCIIIVEPFAQVIG